MKHKRQKHAQKILTFYEKHFKLKPPYNVLVDATFVKEALINKVSIWDQLPKYLGADVHLYTTTCALSEMEQLGRLMYGPLKVMREYKVAVCPHKTAGVDPVDCLHKTTKRSHPDYAGQQSQEELARKNKERRFFVATQYSVLAEKVRRIPGVPVMYLHGNAINLEKPSEDSKKSAGIIVHNKLVPKYEQEQLPLLLEQEGLLEAEDGPTHRKKKLKGPNPLSVRKKKKRDPFIEFELTRRQKIHERRKWRRLRKRRDEKSVSALDDIMLRELALVDLWADKGKVYHKKSIAELEHELKQSSSPCGTRENGFHDMDNNVT